MRYQQGLIEGFLLAHQAQPHILTALHELVSAIPDEAAEEEEPGGEEDEGREEEAVEPTSPAAPPITRARLSDEQKAELWRLYTNEGWNPKRLGEHFGKTAGAIQQLLYAIKNKGGMPGK